MEIEGCSLQKEKTDNYSFYFDKAFLEGCTDNVEQLEERPATLNN